MATWCRGAAVLVPALFAGIVVGCTTSAPRPVTPRPLRPPPVASIEAHESEMDTASALLHLGSLASSEEIEDFPYPGMELEPLDAEPLIAIAERFRRAIAARDGEAAVAELSLDSILYWDDARRAPDEVGLPDSVSSRVSAALARRFTTAEQREAMSGRDLFTLAVNQGWALPRELTPTPLTEPISRVTLGLEVARVWLDDQHHQRIVLDYQDGRWRVRFSAFMKELDRSATGVATMLGLTEQQFVDALTSRIADRLRGSTE